MLRSHDAGSLNAKAVGTNVTLAGWVARRRDHGGVAFIDLRDSTGAVQVVINDEKIAGELRAEWCVLIVGAVKLRPAGNENKEIATGEIEVVCESLEVLSEAAPLPFYSAREVCRRRREGGALCFQAARSARRRHSFFQSGPWAFPIVSFHNVADQAE